MIYKFPVTIPQLSGNEPRMLYVYTPKGYERNRRKRYPVLYLFDGHNMFYDKDAAYGKSWGVGKYLDRTRTQLIVVAIECDKKGGRLSEYSPFDFEDSKYGSVKGRAKLHMDWIVRKLKPEIDKHFRTKRGRTNTFIGGSSMGGLISLYALLQYNRTFGGAMCLSPSLWTAPEKIHELVKKAKLEQDTVLYLDYGANELIWHKGMDEILPTIVGALYRRGISLTFRIVPEGEHCEACWEKQLPFAINTLMYKRNF